MMNLTYAMAFVFPLIVIGCGIMTIGALIPFIRSIYADIQAKAKP